MDFAIAVTPIAAHIIFPFFICSIAKDKGRNPYLWGIFGFLTPTYSLFYVMLVDDRLDMPRFSYRFGLSKNNGI